MANLGTLGIPGSELVGLPQPQGGGWFIALFSGATTAIPVGWALCDGTGGLPDLRDKFIVGAGNTYAVGGTGGATSNTPTFTGTALGVHAHTQNPTTGVFTAGALVAVTDVGSISPESAGTPAGTISAVPTLPPYYALCFIAYIGSGSV